MTRPYTDSDVELVAEANLASDYPTPGAWDQAGEWEREDYRIAARAILSALAAAGRLTPGADSVDEHGNRLDTCGVCPLVPSVSGWALLMQAQCPVHGYWPSAQPVEVADRIAVLSWDWREQPDLAQLARVVRDVSGGTVHVREVDTGGDQFAIVIAGSDLDEADTQAVYERWLHGDTEEVNRGR